MGGRVMSFQAMVGVMGRSVARASCASRRMRSTALHQVRGEQPATRGLNTEGVLRRIRRAWRSPMLRLVSARRLQACSRRRRSSTFWGQADVSLETTADGVGRHTEGIAEIGEWARESRCRPSHVTPSATIDRPDVPPDSTRDDAASACWRVSARLGSDGGACARLRT